MDENRGKGMFKWMKIGEKVCLIGEKVCLGFL